MNVARYQAEKIAKEALKRVEQQVEAAEESFRSFVRLLVLPTRNPQVMKAFEIPSLRKYLRLMYSVRFEYPDPQNDGELTTDFTYFNFPNKSPLPDNGEFVKISFSDYRQVLKLQVEFQNKKDAYKKDRDTLEDALVACRTFKKAAERYPDLVPYFPKEPTNLPAKVYDTSAIQSIIDNAKPLGKL